MKRTDVIAAGAQDRRRASIRRSEFASILPRQDEDGLVTKLDRKSHPLSAMSPGPLSHVKC
jgi:hypothetical protein